jgi:hypothetical protein
MRQLQELLLAQVETEQHLVFQVRQLLTQVVEVAERILHMQAVLVEQEVVVQVVTVM